MKVSFKANIIVEQKRILSMPTGVDGEYVERDSFPTFQSTKELLESKKYEIELIMPIDSEPTIIIKDTI